MKVKIGKIKVSVATSTEASAMATCLSVVFGFFGRPWTTADETTAKVIDGHEHTAQWRDERVFEVGDHDKGTLTGDVLIEVVARKKVGAGDSELIGTARLDITEVITAGRGARNHSVALAGTDGATIIGTVSFVMTVIDGVSSGRSALVAPATTVSSVADIDIPTSTATATTGSRMRCWKDDPTTVGLGVRDIWIPSTVGPGPSDPQIVVISSVGSTSMTDSGDFLPESDEEIEPVHTFVVIRLLVDMFSRYLRLPEVQVSTADGGGSSDVYDPAEQPDPEWQLRWAFGAGPIAVHTRAGWDANAYYSRGDRCLKFFFFKPRMPLAATATTTMAAATGDEPSESSSGGSNDTVYTCRSFDIVAHETGHAVLDALQPGWMDGFVAAGDDEFQAHFWSGALHESFGDLTAIVGHLAQLDVCEALVTLTKGDLSDDNALCLLAPTFSRGLTGKSCLRNARNDFVMGDISAGNGSRVHAEVHSISQIMTGAVYGAIVGVFQQTKDPRLWDVSETLFRIGKKARKLMIYAVIHGPPSCPTFGSFAASMVEGSRSLKGVKGVWEVNLMREFTARGILDERGNQIPPPHIDRSSMLSEECETLRRHRHNHHAHVHP
jgi:hypothetical protein